MSRSATTGLKKKLLSFSGDAGTPARVVVEDRLERAALGEHAQTATPERNTREESERKPRLKAGLLCARILAIHNTMNEEKHYLSKEKHAELTEELALLKGTKRKEIAEQLEYAKSLGDLSENAEYQEARENQAAVEDRIGKLEQILKHAVITKDHHAGMVEIGSHVTVQKEGSKEKESYAIVGSEEADIAEKKLSNESPLGRALLAKKKGDSVVVVTPRGKVTYVILDIA